MSDFIPKITSPAPGSFGTWGRCDAHQCEFITGLNADDEQDRAWDTPRYCPECRRDEREKWREWERQARDAERANEYLRRQARAGVPLRFLHASLETFITDTAPQQEVLAVLRQFSATRGVEPASLLLMGGPGTGKSFAGYALVNAWLQAERTACVFTASAVIRHVRETWRGEGECESTVLKRLATVDLIVLDEVGVQSGSVNELTLLTDILNQRYEQLKPTVAIGNLTMAELTTVLGERAIDRFREGGRVLSFTWPSRRGAEGHSE